MIRTVKRFYLFSYIFEFSFLPRDITFQAGLYISPKDEGGWWLWDFKVPFFALRIEADDY